MPTLKLVYFDVRGRGELIRLIFHFDGVKFEDKRIQFEDWGALKPDVPNGVLPYLEIDGTKLGESLPLARFAAKKHNLGGKNDMEFLLADSVLSMVGDLREEYVRYKFDQLLTEEQKKTCVENFKTKKCPEVFPKFEKMLIDNKTGFLVGKHMTFADLAVMDVCDQIDLECSPEFFAKYPSVTALREKVRSHPKIAAYLSTRKDTEL